MISSALRAGLSPHVYGGERQRKLRLDPRVRTIIV
jgi:hypothetical protein